MRGSIETIIALNGGPEVIDTLYSMLIGSLLVLAIAFVWMVIIALVVATIKRVKSK